MFSSLNRMQFAWQQNPLLKGQGIKYDRNSIWPFFLFLSLSRYYCLLEIGGGEWRNYFSLRKCKFIVQFAWYAVEFFFVAVDFCCCLDEEPWQSFALPNLVIEQPSNWNGHHGMSVTFVKNVIYNSIQCTMCITKKMNAVSTFPCNFCRFFSCLSLQNVLDSRI